MMWRDVIQLLSVTSTVSPIGAPVETTTSRQVFANKKDVRSPEFYQAHATGLRADVMIEIRVADYANEPRFSYEGKEYTIIRTYDKNGEIMELIGQGTVS